MPNSEAKLEQLVKEPYKYGFKTNIETDTIKKGLDEKIIHLISTNFFVFFLY